MEFKTISARTSLELADELIALIKDGWEITSTLFPGCWVDKGGRPVFRSIKDNYPTAMLMKVKNELH